MDKIIIFILLFMTNSMYAQKYVSNTIGNDVNAGTITSPYKTIKKGVTSCPPNQTVFIDPGIYNSLIDINIPITVAQNGITVTKWITGAPNSGDVIIDAVNQTGTNINVNVFDIIGASNITIESIKIKRLKGIEVTGIKVENGGDSIIIRNCSFENIGWKFDDLTSLPPTATITQTYSESAIKIINSTPTQRRKVYIQSNIIFNCAVGYGEAITIVGNVNGFTVSNNLVHDISNIGIDAAGNASYVNGFRSRNGIISNNELYRCMSGVRNSASIYLDGSDSCIVERNKCHHNGVGISFGAEESYLPNTTPRGHIIRNNLVYNNSIFGMVLGANGGRTVQSVRVYNNLLFKNRTFDTINNIISVGGINLLTADASFGGEISFQNSDNLVLKNNIIYRLNNRRAWNVATGYTVSNFTCNNNDYFQDVYSSPIIDISTATFNGSPGLSQNNDFISNFQTNWPGLETNAKELNPAFIDTALKNFQLSPSSPLINKGEFPSLASFVGTLDYYGNTRIVCDTVDIGANEVLLPIVSITNQPTNAVVCVGTTATFSVSAAGSNISYKWQESIDGGNTWTTINNGGTYSGATTNMLTLNPVTSGMNNYRYRCSISGQCSLINSSPATLTLTNPPTVTTQPVNGAICANQSTSFSVVATGTNLTYQWQVSTTGCAGTWTNLANNTNYSGVTNTALQLTVIPVTFNGYAYRCIISGACTPQAISNCCVLTVSSPITIVTQPSNVSACNGSLASFTVTANGGGINYQWQVSTNGGSTFSNINGQTQATLNLTAITQLMNGNIYRCILSSISNCNSTVTSNNAILTVLPTPPITISTPNTTICEGTTTTLNATSGFQNYTWIPTSVGNTSTVTISPTATTTYSVTGTSSNGCTNSATSIITVTLRPVINSLTAFPYTSLLQGQTTTITVTASSPTTTNLVYSWGYLGGGSTQTFSGNTHVVDFSHIGIYTVKVSEASNPNCISLPKSIGITGSTSSSPDSIIIYPNVNNGFFNIRFNGFFGKKLIVIYDAKGAFVYNKEIEVTQLNKIFDINLKRASSGTYFVSIYNENKEIIETRKVLIEH